MANTEWSVTSGEFYTNLSESTDKKIWYCDVEIDSQTIVYSSGNTDIEAMRGTVSELNSAIEQLLNLKSAMVMYLVDKDTR